MSTSDEHLDWHCHAHLELLAVVVVVVVVVVLPMAAVVRRLVPCHPVRLEEQPQEPHPQQHRDAFNCHAHSSGSASRRQWELPPNLSPEAAVMSPMIPARTVLNSNSSTPAHP